MLITSIKRNGSWPATPLMEGISLRLLAECLYSMAAQAAYAKVERQGSKDGQPEALRSCDVSSTATPLSLLNRIRDTATLWHRLCRRLQSWGLREQHLRGEIRIFPSRFLFDATWNGCKCMHSSLATHTHRLNPLRVPHIETWWQRNLPLHIYLDFSLAAGSSAMPVVVMSGLAGGLSDTASFGAPPPCDSPQRLTHWSEGRLPDCSLPCLGCWGDLWQQVLLQGWDVQLSIILLRVGQHGQHLVHALQPALHEGLVHQLQRLLAVAHKVQHLQRNAPARQPASGARIASQKIVMLLGWA